MKKNMLHSFKQPETDVCDICTVCQVGLTEDSNDVNKMEYDYHKNKLQLTILTFQNLTEIFLYQNLIMHKIYHYLDLMSLLSSINVYSGF